VQNACRKNAGCERAGGRWHGRLAKGKRRNGWKMCHKTGIEKTKDLQKIQKDYEETVQALKRIDEIWETLTRQ